MIQTIFIHAYEAHSFWLLYSKDTNLSASVIAEAAAEVSHSLSFASWEPV